MTEALRQGLAFPVARREHGIDGSEAAGGRRGVNGDATVNPVRSAGAVTAPVARAAVRRFALPAVPAHVGVMLGLSAAGYGLTLAAVTALQSNSEAAIVADRAPAAAAIEQLATGHASLASSLAAAANRYAAAAAGYGDAAQRLGAVEAELGALSKAVAGVDGASRALPASAPLPTVVRSVRVGTQTAAHATSGGSAVP